MGKSQTLLLENLKGEKLRTREKQVIVRLSLEEYYRLIEKSEKVGLTISDFLRTYINGFEPREKPPIEFYEAIKQIRKVGNNINQIARLANATGILDELACKRQFDKLNETILEMKQEFLLPKKIDK